MAEAVQHFQHGAGQPQLAFHRLIGVRIGAKGDRAGLIAWLAKLLFQKRRDIGLEHQLRFEIEPWREAQIGMGWPRIAVDAAMFAATIGVDGPVKT